MEAGRRAGFAFGWGADDPQAAERTAYRTAYTVETPAPRLRALLWERVAASCPAVVSYSAAAAAALGDASLEGRWAPAGVAERLLLVEYRAGGHFSPHVDGYLVLGPERRSLYTMLLYLNRPVGGATRLLQVPAEGATEEGHALLAVDAGGRTVGGAGLKVLYKHQPRDVGESTRCWSTGPSAAGSAHTVAGVIISQV